MTLSYMKVGSPCEVRMSRNELDAPGLVCEVGKLLLFNETFKENVLQGTYFPFKVINFAIFQNRY